MSCSWCKKKDYFVMKIPCNHYICLSCLKTHSLTTVAFLSFEILHRPILLNPFSRLL